MADEPTPPAEPAPAEPATPEPAPAPPAPAADDKPLGSEGEKALQIWKDRAKAAETDAKRAKELEAELDQLRTSQMSEHEKALKEAAANARNETLSEVNQRLFAAELKAASVGKIADPELLADPEVAVRLLGLDGVPVTDSGDIDAEAISAAVDSFLESKPYLSGATPPGDGPAPLDLGQGARGTQSTTSQLTKNDLVAMSPEQIDQARRDGRLDDVMAGKG